MPFPTQSYSASHDPHLAVNEFESGYRARQRFSDDDESISVSWEFSQLQLDRFMRFYQVDLKNGSLPFVTSIAGTDGFQSVEVQLKEGRFSKTYKSHARWNVSAVLLRTGHDVMDEEVYDLLAMDEFADPDLFTLSADALYTYIELTFGVSAADDITAAFMRYHS